MAVIPYSFVIDTTKKRLLEAVGSLNPADVPQFFRNDTAAFTVKMVTPGGSFSDPTPIKNFPSGSALTLAIGSVGISADVIAGAPAGVTDAVSIAGMMELNTIGFRQLLDGKPSQPASLEFRLTEADGTKTVLAQVECVIRDVVTLDGATPVEESTTAGLAIALCEAAAATASTAASGVAAAVAQANAAATTAATAATNSAASAAAAAGSLASIGSPGVVAISSAGTVALTSAAHRGKIIEVTATTGTVNITAGDSLPLGFACEVINAGAGATVTFNHSGTKPRYNQGALYSVRGVASIRTGATYHYLTGDLQ